METRAERGDPRRAVHTERAQFILAPSALAGYGAPTSQSLSSVRTASATGTEENNHQQYEATSHQYWMVGDHVQTLSHDDLEFAGCRLRDDGDVLCSSLRRHCKSWEETDHGSRGLETEVGTCQRSTRPTPFLHGKHRASASWEASQTGGRGLAAGDRFVRNACGCESVLIPRGLAHSSPAVGPRLPLIFEHSLLDLFNRKADSRRRNDILSAGAAVRMLEVLRRGPAMDGCCG